MPAGEAFTPDQRRVIEKAIRTAEDATGYAFSVYVGAAEGDPRLFARHLHRQLDDPASSVLVFVDPVARALETVTRSRVRREIGDAAAGRVALSMQQSFAAGELAGGLISGIYQIGEHGRRPTSLHTEPLP